MRSKRKECELVEKRIKEILKKELLDLSTKESKEKETEFDEKIIKYNEVLNILVELINRNKNKR